MFTYLDPEYIIDILHDNKYNIIFFLDENDKTNKDLSCDIIYESTNWKDSFSFLVKWDEFCNYFKTNIEKCCNNDIVVLGCKRIYWVISNASCRNISKIFSLVANVNNYPLKIKRHLHQFGDFRKYEFLTIIPEDKQDWSMLAPYSKKDDENEAYSYNYRIQNPREFKIIKNKKLKKDFKLSFNRLKKGLNFLPRFKRYGYSNLQYCTGSDLPCSSKSCILKSWISFGMIGKNFKYKDTKYVSENNQCIIDESQMHKKPKINNSKLFSCPNLNLMARSSGSFNEKNNNRNNSNLKITCLLKPSTLTTNCLNGNSHFGSAFSLKRENLVYKSTNLKNSHSTSSLNILSKAKSKRNTI